MQNKLKLNQDNQSKEREKGEFLQQPEDGCTKTQQQR